MVRCQAQVSEICKNLYKPLLDNEIDDFIRYNDGFYHVFAVDCVLNLAVSHRNLQCLLLRAVHRERHGALYLAVYLNRQLDRALDRLCLVVLRPRSDVTCGANGLSSASRVLYSARLTPFSVSWLSSVIICAMAVFIFRFSMSSETFLMV